MSENLEIVTPLTRLTRRGIKLMLNDAYEANFQGVKQKLVMVSNPTIYCSEEAIMIYIGVPRISFRVCIEGK